MKIFMYPAIVKDVLHYSMAKIQVFCKETELFLPIFKTCLISDKHDYYEYLHCNFVK